YHFPTAADPYAGAQQPGMPVGQAQGFAPPFDPYPQSGGFPGQQSHDQWNQPAGNFAAPQDWGHPQSAYAQGSASGYDQNSLQQTYAEDDAAYEAASPRRGRKIAMVLAGFVMAGGGLAYAYSALLGPTSDGSAPPVVKSADGPFKVKPSDPGGKQF